MTRAASRPLTAALLAAASLGAATAAAAGQSEEASALRAGLRPEAATLHLFEDRVPAGMTVSSGELTLSTERYKDGRRSLKWSLAPGSQLTIAHPFVYRPFVPNPTDQRRFGITLWIYNPVPRTGSFSFDFHRGAARATGFKMNADFAGWRAAVVTYETDMTGSPVGGLDRLVITPPAGMDAGAVHLDQVGLDVLVDPRHPAPDYQLPMLNPSVTERANSHWTAVLHEDTLLRAAETRNARAGATPPADVSAILQRIDSELLLGKTAPIEAIERGFRDLHGPDGMLKPLAETSQQWAMYRENGVSKEQLALLRDSSMTWRELGAFLQSVAVSYRRSESPSDRKRMQSIFVELVRHQTDQGLVRGSGQGILHHQGYQLAEWSEALFLMRDAMGDQADVAREAMAWYAGLGRIHEPAVATSDFNADVMNTLLEPMLFSILMDADTRRRAATLRDFSAWISASTFRSPGVGGGIKPDGTMFHHSQHYVAYGNGALTGLTEAIYFLSGSPFRVTRQAHERTRQAVLATRLLSNRGRFLMSLSGRHVEGDQAIAIAPFRYMALAGDAGGSGPDREMAGAFLRLAQGRASMPRIGAAERATAAQLARAGMTAEPDPDGSWALNHSSMVLHRRNGWLLGARGFSRYLVGNESYPGKNVFGRYINYGSLEFLPADPARRGYSMPGWDWTRWPGTTAQHVPLERLRAKLTQVDEESGVEEMLLSEQTFSGGLDHRGRQAMFAMKLQGHAKYGDDLAARKSFFFFDGRVVALGSGISAGSGSAPVQTTVFQDRVQPGGVPAALEGLPDPDDRPETAVRISSWRWARDENGNGVCLAPGQNVLFHRGPQNSIDAAGAKATTGRFATLVIDHGASPRHAGYEYALLAGAGGARTQQFCRDLGSAGTAPYSVLARTERAHVVRDAATGLTGYALFEPGPVAAPGVVSAVSGPSMLMVRSEGSTLEGAFVNPDLNLYEGRDPNQYDRAGRLRERSVYALPWRMNAAQPVRTRVTFRGRWRLVEPLATMRSSYDAKTRSTTVTFVTSGAQPTQFTMARN